jgi:hypothetical protein
MGGVTTGNIGNPLCQALAEPPPGGNGCVRAGVSADTAPSWRVSCSPVSSVTAEVGIPGEEARGHSNGALA